MRADPLIPGTGVWVAYYRDWSGMAAFATEIEALRYGVKHSMDVSYIPYGADFRELTN